MEQSNASSRTSQSFALLIGIDKYQHHAVTPLRGAVEDMGQFKSFLVERLKLKVENITTLTDKEATREKIISAFQQLQDNISYGATVIIYYAGHGASVKRPPTWQESGGDRVEAIVPHDFGDGCPVIPDRTLRALIYSIQKAKGDNITVVFDCCHSGSGTRGGEEDVRVRSATSALENISLRSDLDGEIIKEAHAIGHLPKIGSSGSQILLAACQKSQLAREKKNRGRFTMALLDTLKRVDLNETTYLQLMVELPNIPGQDPQCEGLHKNRILFQNKFANRGWHKISRLNSPPIATHSPSNAAENHGTSPRRPQTNAQRYVVFCGEVHGISIETRLAVYVEEEFLGELIAETVHATQTEARCEPNFDPKSYLSNREGATIEVLDTGVLHVAVSPNTLRIAEDLRMELSVRRGIILEGDPAHAQLSIDFASGSAKFSINLNNLVVHLDKKTAGSQSTGFWQCVGKIDNPSLSALLAIIPSAEKYCWHLHRQTTKPLIGKNVTLSFREIDFEDSESGEIVSKAVGEDIYEPGGVSRVPSHDSTYYGLTITNNSRRDLFVAAFVFQSTLSIETIYESNAAAGQADYCLAALQSLRFGYDLLAAELLSFTADRLRSSLTASKSDFCCIKLFLSSQPLALNIRQSSPFDLEDDGDDEYRGMLRPKADALPQLQRWEAISVPILIIPN